jgi:hypothetical protein
VVDKIEAMLSGWRSAVIAVPTAPVNKLPNLVEPLYLVFSIFCSGFVLFND